MAGSARWAALRLLRAADDAELGALFGDRSDAQGLLAVLEEGIPADLRRDLDRFLADRFEGGRAALAAGRVVPTGQPAGEFAPELIVPELAGLAVEQELTAGQLGQVQAALAGRPDRELAGPVRKLPEVQRARAAWWLRQARAAVGWADKALGYLSGDPGNDLTANEQRELDRGAAHGAGQPRRACACPGHAADG